MEHVLHVKTVCSLLESPTCKEIQTFRMNSWKSGDFNGNREMSLSADYDEDYEDDDVAHAMGGMSIQVRLICIAPGPGSGGCGVLNAHFFNQTLGEIENSQRVVS